MLGVLLALAAAPAFAITTSTSVFQFIGDCDDCCDGFGTAIATLTLQDYTLGSDILQANFVSFVYHGTNLMPGGYALSLAGLDDLAGNMTGNPGPAFFRVSGYIPGAQPAGIGIAQSGYYWFHSSTGGMWQTGEGWPDADRGYSHSWAPAAIPEPGAWLLTGAGLLGLLARLRRRR